MSRLQRKVHLILLALGHGLDDIRKSQVYRLRAGEHQCSAGAWSWATKGTLDVGSLWSMRQCAREPVVVTLTARQYHLDPERGTAPGGASFAIEDKATSRLVWHGEDGEPLAA
jgi:hypothetical protein